MNWIVRLLLNAIIIFLASALLPGFYVASFYTAIIVAIVLGLINVTIKPLLIILTLPINIVTLGFFTFIINALLLLLTASIVKGFEIRGFLWALFASLFIAGLQVITRKLDRRY